MPGIKEQNNSQLTSLGFPRVNKDVSRCNGLPMLRTRDLRSGAARLAPSFAPLEAHLWQPAGHRGFQPLRGRFLL